MALWTRDGSRVGNGILYGLSENPLFQKRRFLVETDFGNRMILSREELLELYSVGDPQSYEDWLVARQAAQGREDRQRAERVGELFTWFHEAVESLDGTIGSDLSYLLASVARGDHGAVQLDKDQEILLVMTGGRGYEDVAPLPPGHWVWEYIVVEEG